MAMRKHVKVSGQCDPGLPKLVGDPTRLRQILINLADNALKFTPENGTITIRVEMTTMDPEPDSNEGMVLFAARQPAAKITVADTGVGIPDEAKLKVFDAFYQVDSGTTRQVGGTGLGLSIVKRLVEGHQGHVIATDNEPTGAAFIVTIPFRHITLS
jgi:two-component system phosphate regulon sensor histidine kinase PhoR